MHPQLSLTSLDFFDTYDKPSSLKSKVKEREQRRQRKEQLLSQLSALDVPVPGVDKLKAECGRSHYRQALLLMLQATTLPGLEMEEKQRLMEVRLSYRNLCKWVL